LASKTVRPKVTTGSTIRKVTGCGKLYVTINRDNNGRNPIEVLARLGKAGGCTHCQNEALTRAITMGLKYGAPAQEFVDELIGLQCPSPNMWPEAERTLSCPDAIAQALKECMNEDNKV